MTSLGIALLCLCVVVGALGIAAGRGLAYALYWSRKPRVVRIAETLYRGGRAVPGYAPRTTVRRRAWAVALAAAGLGPLPAWDDRAERRRR